MLGANPLDVLEVRATQAIPSATTDAAIGNWNHTTDRNWHGYIDFIYLWNHVLDRPAGNPKEPPQFMKPACQAAHTWRTASPAPPLGDSGKRTIVSVPDRWPYRGRDFADGWGAGNAIVDVTLGEGS